MASKANGKGTTTGGESGDEGGDAPLLDLNEASVKKLIARAKKRGYITYDELNEALPQDQMSSEQIEDVMSALNDMGVNIVENEEASARAREVIAHGKTRLARTDHNNVETLPPGNRPVGHPPHQLHCHCSFLDQLCGVVDSHGLLRTRV